MKNKNGLKVALSIVSIGILFFTIYQFAFASTFGGSSFFRSDPSSNAINISQVAKSNNNLVQTASSSNGAITFTASELTQYNGMNGNPAYVAVDGIVYDMTKIGQWKNGQHQGLSAGQDLSAAFAGSPHTKAILDQSPIVGAFVTEKAATKVVDSVTSATVPDASNNTISQAASSNTGLISLTQTATTPSQTWTLKKLSTYNGMNGNPAYIAVNGTIYNVTNIGTWTSGVHHGIHAGADVTSFFATSPHSASLLNQVPVVGKIGGTITNTTSAPSSSTSGLISGDYDDDHDQSDDHDDEDGDD